MKTMEEMRKNELRSVWKQGLKKLGFLAKDAVVEYDEWEARKTSIVGANDRAHTSRSLEN